jgi:tetratricopeptide (TPR) repeat protein
MLAHIQLGPYTLVEEVGKGGMAAVYRAHQTSVDRDVAIKVILKGIAGDPSAIQRFQREAKLIARLEHPHIVPVYDFDGTHEPPYIVMRYLDGGTLKEVMAQGLLPHNEVVALMQQMCSALDYAHRQGIIHRDIKPSNILIDREGNAFVGDLGLARLIGAEGSGKQITETGAIMGTPDYMSPEQATSSENIDQRTDLYALGIMLFEMLTGTLPFEASSGMQMLMQHIQSPIPSVLTHQPDLPPAIDSVLERVLAKDPTQRYQTTMEFSQAVARALGITATGVVVRLRAAASTSILRRRGKPSQTDSQATPSEQNKTLTVLYAHAAAYEELVAEQQGDEAARRALTVFWKTVERLIRDSGGQIFTRTDHDLLAVWGAETAREDDPERAIRAALHMQTVLRELGAAFLDTEEPLPLNIGLHRGLALLTPGEKSGSFSATGATMGLANRLMQSADGTVLVTHEVFRQVLGVFDIQEDDPIKVRGRSEKVKTYRVLLAKARAFRIVLHGVEGIDTPLVGREADFKQLQKAFLMAFEDRETQVVTLVSDAGVGKSRLLYEFDKWAELRTEQYRVFSGRATPAMTQRPYAFLRDLVAMRFEVLDDDAPAVALHKIETGITELIGRSDETAHFIAYLVGIDVTDSPYVKGLLNDAQEARRRARQAFIHFLSTLAGAEPVLLELEDLHHADEASLEVLEELLQSDEERALLVIACARPGLYERRPTWGRGQRFHSRLDLKPLDKRDSRDLALAILQKVPDVPKGLRDLLVERAEGNPLYMEELVKMLLDDRVLIKENEDQWRIESERLGALNVPTTLSGLLETRLDTLLAPEKLTLQRASVIGRVFYDTALRAIEAHDETPVRDLSGILAQLVTRGFIDARGSSSFTGSVEYSFASTLLRDTIYDRLLERQRRLYHAGTGAWLASLERADEYLPLIAEHFEKADDAVQAAAYWQRAGDIALRRGTYAEAITFYQRALTHQPPDRLTLLLALGEGLNWRGDLGAARPVLTEALALARSAANPEQLALALYHLSLTETTYGDYPAALKALDEALPLARAGTQPQVLAQVLYGLADTHFRSGTLAEGIAAAEACIGLCEQTGNEVLRMYALNRLGTLVDVSNFAGAGNALMYYEAGLALARQLRHQEGEGSFLGNLAAYASDRADWLTAVHYGEQALRLAREQRSLLGIAIETSNLAEYSINAGRPEKAPSLLRESLLTARQMASATRLVSTLASAGLLKLARGQTVDGLRLLGLVLAHPAASADLKESILLSLNSVRITLGMGDAEIDAGLAAGVGLEVDPIVDALLREFEG